MTLNLDVDGGPDVAGRPPEPWWVAHDEILAPRRPDVLLRQEAQHSHRKGNRRLHQAEQVLNMRGFLGPHGPGDNPTALFVRPQIFTVRQHNQHPTPWRIPPTNIIARLSGTDRDIVMTSWHAAFNLPSARKREAEEIAALADKMKHGLGFLGGGDCNEYPWPQGESIAPIDWSSADVTDHVHMVHRTRKTADGSWTGCTDLDETLLRCGLHDPARYAAHELHQPGALAPTAGHAPAAAGQGGGQRIDRIYLDPWLIQAVLEVSRVDTSGVSDHHALEVVLSHHKAIETLNRAVEPMPPIAVSA